MAKDVSREKMNKGLFYTSMISIFAIAGILITVFFPMEGAAMLGPLLLGPGITILLLGLSFGWSLGPAIGLSNEGFGKKISYAYIVLGALFSIMGFFLWMLG
jgi:hypothetical protein